MELRKIAACLAAVMMFCASCTDDGDEPKINNQDKWIGAKCECEGSGCQVASIPIPVPMNSDKVSGKIIGCENIDMTDIEGGEPACIRSIDPDFKSMAPITYFPQGYCSIVASSCTGSDFCFAANYGDPSKMTACPKGSTMLSAVFNYKIMGQDSVIVEKMCMKTCEKDADCNVAGQISCVERKGHKFCYNEKNFEIFNDPEKIDYIEF